MTPQTYLQTAGLDKSIFFYWHKEVKILQKDVTALKFLRSLPHSKRYIKIIFFLTIIKGTVQKGIPNHTKLYWKCLLEALPCAYIIMCIYHYLYQSILLMRAKSQYSTVFALTFAFLPYSRNQNRLPKCWTYF